MGSECSLTRQTHLAVQRKEGPLGRGAARGQGLVLRIHLPTSSVDTDCFFLLGYLVDFHKELIFLFLRHFVFKMNKGVQSESVQSVQKQG